MSDRAVSITFATLAFLVSFMCYIVGHFQGNVFFGMVGIAIAAFSKK
jgi:hypothetical protein